MTERHLPQPPLGPDGPYLAAILDVLDAIAATLYVHLRPGTGRARPDTPGRARPVQEPAPDRPPNADDDEPVPVNEPAPPPRAGRGASATAWRAYADARGVTYPADAGRDDLIAACAQADIPI